MTTYETEDGTLLDPGDVVDKARALDMLTKVRSDAEAKGYKAGLEKAADELDCEAGDRRLTMSRATYREFLDMAARLRALAEKE